MQSNVSTSAFLHLYYHFFCIFFSAIIYIITDSLSPDKEIHNPCDPNLKACADSFPCFQALHKVLRRRCRFCTHLVGHRCDLLTALPSITIPEEKARWHEVTHEQSME